MSLEARLFEFRQNAKVSLQKVADAVGVSKAHIWELEKGRSTNPSFDLVRKLAAFYAVTPEELIGEADVHLVQHPGTEARADSRHGLPINTFAIALFCGSVPRDNDVTKKISAVSIRGDRWLSCRVK